MCEWAIWKMGANASHGPWSPYLDAAALHEALAARGHGLERIRLGQAAGLAELPCIRARGTACLNDWFIHSFNLSAACLPRQDDPPDGGRTWLSR
jgi:hypothetical protein